MTHIQTTDNQGIVVYKITEQDVLMRVMSKGLKPTTHKNYLCVLRGLGLLNIEFTAMDAYTAVSKYTNSNTRRGVITILKIFGVPTPPLPKQVSRQYYLPTQEEYEFYRALFPHPDRLDLMYYAGLRVGEACSDKNIVMGNVLNVQFQRTRQAKNEPAKTTGNVIIPQWLASKFPLEPWEGTSNRMSLAVTKHSKRLGIPIMCHGLRAAYATRLVEAGIDILGLKQQMRHTNVVTTLDFYVQVKQGNLTGLIDGL